MSVASNVSGKSATERSDYVFVNREAEQRRLERQAEIIDPLTERVFQAAGLGSGMRVLDLGSGAGDVALLAARLVRSDGEVVGVERDPTAVAAATARVARGGLSNVRFVEGDAQTLDGVKGDYDAVVGRLVLLFLPDPVAALARASERLRPGGLVCFHEGDQTYDWAAPMTSLWTQVRLRPRDFPARACESTDGSEAACKLRRRWLAVTRAANGMRAKRRPQRYSVGAGLTWFAECCR